MTDDTATDAAAEDAPQYAIIEIFGHRRHAGRILEVEQFGSKMLRIDIPKDGDFELGFSSHFYGGAAIFSMTPCDLAAVVRANRPYQPAALFSPEADDEPDLD